MYHPAQLHADVAEPSADLVSFVKRQVKAIQQCRGDEQRTEDRFLMVLPVVVQPLDDLYEAVDEPFTVVTRDISAKGIGLVHTHRIDHQFMALRFTLADEEVNVAVKVRWCQELGPYYYIGGAFVAKLPFQR